MEPTKAAKFKNFTEVVRMDQTNADLLLECSQKIIGLLCSSEEIAKLLLDDPQATANDLIDDSGNIRHIFDYDYVDESTQEVATFICVEVTLPQEAAGNIRNIEAAVQVVSHKSHMRLDGALFPGADYSRRDAIVRHIDLLLGGRTDFGIGKLTLLSIEKTELPAKYTGKTLRYSVSVFGKSRRHA